MRIIKGRDLSTVLRIIAGEMINIETGVLQFIDGTAVKLDDAVGYPRFISGGIRYDFSVRAGVIFVPDGVDHEALVRDLWSTVAQMEQEADLQKVRLGPVVSSSWHTTVFGQYVEQDPPRIWGRPDDRQSEFQWDVQPIHKIHNHNEISHTVASIMWDRDNVTTCEHNEVTFDFNRACLRGRQQVIDVVVHVTKNVVGESPLLVELNEFWRNRSLFALGKPIVRNIVTKNLYVGPDFNKMRFVNTRGDVGGDCCESCGSKLYGDFYAACEVLDADCTPICALCLHAAPVISSPIEKNFYLLRVKHNRSVDDMINMSLKSEEEKTILRSMLARFQCDGDVFHVGDEYIGVRDIDRFLYSGCPGADGKKIFRVHIADVDEV